MSLGGVVISRSSEYKSREQIYRVVISRVSAGAVVVFGKAVKSPIARVLRGQVYVLGGPPGDVRNVTAAVGAAVGASGDRARPVAARIVEREIASACRIKPSERARIAIAKMIFGVRLNRVQVVLKNIRALRVEFIVQRRILPNIGPAQRNNIVVKPRNRAVVLEIGSHVIEIILKTGH